MQQSFQWFKFLENSIETFILLIMNVIKYVTEQL